jgi:hypothetical protein
VEDEGVCAVRGVEGEKSDKEEVERAGVGGEVERVEGVSVGESMMMLTSRRIEANRYCSTCVSRFYFRRVYFQLDTTDFSLSCPRRTRNSLLACTEQEVALRMKDVVVV